VPSFTNLTSRLLIVLTGAALGTTLLPTAAWASPTAACDGTHHSDTGHGANRRGAYDETCDGSPSGNGNGEGQAKGKPCAGCVGNADDKNPKGQASNGDDRNAGYECDRNHGVGRTNPAHTDCSAADTDSTSTGGKVGTGKARGRGTPSGAAAVHAPPAPSPDPEPAGLVVDVPPADVADPASDTAVLGVSFVRPAPDPAASPSVATLGAEAARSGEGEGVLPLTGGRGLDPAALALALVALGTVLVRVGRRPVGDRVW
jgi:hypothetical protein